MKQPVKCSPDMFTRWYCGGKSPSPTSLWRKKNIIFPPRAGSYLSLKEGRANRETVGCLAFLPLHPGHFRLQLNLLLDWENWNLQSFANIKCHLNSYYLIRCGEARVPMGLLLIFRRVSLDSDIGSEKAHTSHPGVIPV